MKVFELAGENRRRGTGDSKYKHIFQRILLHKQRNDVGCDWSKRWSHVRYCVFCFKWKKLHYICIVFVLMEVYM